MEMPSFNDPVPSESTPFLLSPNSFLARDDEDAQQHRFPHYDLIEFGESAVIPSHLPDVFCEENNDDDMLLLRDMIPWRPTEISLLRLAETPPIIHWSEPFPFSVFDPSTASTSVPPPGSQRHLSPIPYPRTFLEPEHWHPLIIESKRGPMVPQKRYKPLTSSDRRRYVDEVELEPPIVFDVQKPHEEGIPLRDAMHGRFARLVSRDEPTFQRCGPSVTIRINWPGYRPWGRQIPTRESCNPPEPVTRAKLAKNVAKSVARFISEHKGYQMEEGDDEAWLVGPRKIDLFDLVLVRLDHVSKGSWQPRLQLIRPRSSVY